MRYGVVGVGVLTAGVLLVGSASAQEVVHALSGTFVSVNQGAKTMQIRTNDGSDGTFVFGSRAKPVEMNFDRDVKDRTTPVSSFNKPNEQVVVYYYGAGDGRTAVAIQDLGPGPFDTVEGTVTKFNKHQHSLTVKTAAGKEQSFQMDPKAMADGMEGAVPAEKLDVSKGDTVRVIANKGGGGAETALFIND